MVTQTLAEGLNAAGVPSDVLCASSAKRTTIHCLKGYRVVRVGSLGTVFSVSVCPMLIVWLWRVHRTYDVIHIHLPNPLAALAIFLIQPKAKLVLHWHGDVDSGKFRFLTKIYAPLSRWLLRRSSAVVGATQSHINCSEFRKHMVGKYTVIPYPFAKPHLDIDIALDPVEEKDFAGRFVIFGVGRLIYYKGFKFLIEAAKYLPDDCLIIIAGSGPLSDELNDQIKREQLTERVILTGSLESSKLVAYLNACDVFCFPSVYRGEMFGMAQVEAMSFGKPVVGTLIPNSGVHEVNVDGVTGLSVPIMNSHSIADAVLKLKENPDLRSRLGEAGRSRVASLYDTTVVIPQFIELFRKCVSI